jgi:hypothetical protein
MWKQYCQEITNVIDASKRQKRYLQQCFIRKYDIKCTSVDETSGMAID